MEAVVKRKKVGKSAVLYNRSQTYNSQWSLAMDMLKYFMVDEYMEKISKKFLWRKTIRFEYFKKSMTRESYKK